MNQTPNTPAPSAEQMPASREMDYKLIAALKWETHFDSASDNEVRYKRDGALLWSGEFRPSTDIAAALAAAESLSEDFSIYREECQYSVDLSIPGVGFGHGNAKRAALAISRAILLASTQEGGETV